MSRSFSGLSDHIDSSSAAPQGTGDFAYFARINPTTLTAANGDAIWVIQNGTFGGNGFLWGIRRNNTWQIFWYNPNGGSTGGSGIEVIFAASGWQWMCSTQTGSFMTHYASNNPPGDASSGYQTITTPSGQINLNYNPGTFNPGSGTLTPVGLNGMLADVAIWSCNLTGDEVRAMGIKGARPYQIRPRNLVAWFPLDGLQSPEPDLSGGARNGTLTGTTKGTTGPPYMPFTPRWPQQLFPVPPPTLMPQIVT